MKIKYRLLIAFLLVAILPTLVTGTVIFSQAEKKFEDQILEQHNFALHEEIEEAELIIKNYMSKALLIRDLPSVQGLQLNTADESRISDEMKSDFTTIFQHLVDVDKDFNEMMYIDIEGTELVHVVNHNGTASAIAQEQLRDNVTDTDVLTVLELTGSDVYISPLSLAREKDGSVAIPHKPVLKFGVPVLGQNREKKGAFFFEVSADEILEVVSKNTIGYTSLIDENGSYLYHPDEIKNFSAQLGNNFNYFSDHEDFVSEMESKQNDISFDAHHDEHLIWHRISYNPANADQYWILISTIESEELFASISELQNLSLIVGGITVLVIIVFSVIFARSIFVPLQRFNTIAKDISRGNLNAQIDEKLMKSKDELGDLARTFSRTMVSLKLAMEEKTTSQMSSRDDDDDDEDW